MLWYLKNCGLSTLIYFKPDPDIGNKPDNNQDSLEFDIKTHTGDINTKILLLYIPISNTGLGDSLLKVLFFLKKILRCHNLITVPQCYAMTKNLLEVDPLQLFKHKSWATGNKTTTNYELVMQDLTT